MEKRKQLLDSLDAAFAAKKPKLTHAKPLAPGIVQSSKPNQKANQKANNTVGNQKGNQKGYQKPKSAPPSKPTAKQQAAKSTVDPLYATLTDDVKLRLAPSATKGRQNIKLLETQLAAMALKKPSTTEDFVEKIKSKALQLHNPHKAKKTVNAALQSINFPKRLSQGQRRAAGFHVATPSLPYASALELHDLWLQYMADLIGNEDLSVIPASTSFATCSFGAKLRKADYNGCLLTVVRSRNPGLIGLEGVVLAEHKNVFQLVTAKEKVVLVPKVGSSFAFTLDTSTFRFEGDDFASRQ
ncbi:hypothetical protein SPRG_02363 [Saprolegnia parasitica CBS 223.65]|uniref:Uncharacterized protein n=1 Tax=Saprolegnia parasitica (strain CBS 223.65) TaxID=695850 RepID=A0A067D0W6_SAPPC|nr:hypothetical protein SPRG_02363 [Saprolegnia parasitica CBS 223.65]KDO32662.1 hypothetical protein SPRG_02363 [Saprolegnia parasitica CBS 223.65]|eukprot:XP_012196329.1 hypothetical protein SPRG_02363 [Saprolegnia parasitica CBS 223.65]